MDFLKKLNTVLLSLAVLLAVSCGKESKKEDPEPEQVQNPVRRTCQLTGQNQGGGFYNTYVSDSTGKIIRINYNVPLIRVLLFKATIKS
ncbi:hypothetical protein I5M27_09425 [Adhaeribacter sp. BT258]|uniref:Lipoprotein n=1 Tax=Adhaeribacter terrigena TaxID=2793070 RepID=A0ABS1C3U0_9BACT|nr:hypothetical protein [Adhaeribacter terrigena]MBK0403205.1 hypothetical protein [Adhaeribacter terrigena]